MSPQYISNPPPEGLHSLIVRHVRGHVRNLVRPALPELPASPEVDQRAGIQIVADPTTYA